MTDREAVLATAMNKLTVNSVVTINRAEGDVFVDGELVVRILDDNPEAAEDFADRLWTGVEDLKAARAGFTNA